MENEDLRLVQQTPGFRDMDALVLEALLAETTARGLGPGEHLFHKGQEFLNEVYVLRRGRIEIRRSDGRTEQPPPGYLLGLSSYLSESPYASTAVALDEVEVLVLAAARLRRLEARHPPLFDAVNRLIAVGLRERSIGASITAGGLEQPARSIMSTPLSRCAPETSLREALQAMLAANVGSLAVVDADGALAGIVTYRSMARRMALAASDPARDPVARALLPVATVSADTPIWQAQDLQERRRLKYLVVTEDNRPVGMLSQTDIVHELMLRQGGVHAQISGAGSYAELLRCYSAIVDLGAHALETNRRARVAVRVLSETHLAIQRRCVELTLAELESEGAGTPPAPYAVIVMGSGGRREMMLDPDQDNGLIVADRHGSESAGVQAWFETFSDRLNVNLDRSGYILCPGDIMARNPKYRKSLAGWRDQITHIARGPSQKAARWSSIFFDFDTLYGDHELTHSLRGHVNDQLEENLGLLKYMVEDDAQGRAPISWFNRLIATGRKDGKETVDVKRNGLRMVANAARILALRSGISHCNTSERIESLVRHGVLSVDFGATVSSAYDELLDMLLCHQISQKQAGIPLDKEVAPEDLTAPAREALRVSMRAVKRFQEKLQDEIIGLAL